MSLTSALVVLLAAAVFQPKIPLTWNDADVAALEVPLANAKYSPVHVSSETYYKIPARVLYKSYPVYHPDREPPGYMEWLKKQDPEVAFDPANLKTREDWVKAGELVFNAPTSHNAVFFGAQDVRDRKFYEQTHMPVAKDGTIPFARWVVRKKGEVELGSMGCATCHTRVMPDGVVVPGAQGNNPGDRQGAWTLRRAAATADPEKILTRMRGFARQFEMPWLPDDPNRRAREMSLDELIATGEAIPPGVTARSNTSMFYPPQIPDLIGVQDRSYLDHTGLVRHRGIGDLMRYSSLAQDVFTLDRYGNGPAAAAGHGARYSDEQLYALVLYLYSLQPPPNPNRFDEAAARGKRIFERERCGGCHTPPLYTNNKLIPADGFDPLADHARRFDILPTRIGVDPSYALQTHKGTGYYKVPSLKGIWYRGPLEHNGSVATLEDWFDPARVRDDYVPTGFKGYDGKRRSVRGHRFGLNLQPAEKQALIAFLKTL
jgi:mono/diheme cytochrome c family protein